MSKKVTIEILKKDDYRRLYKPFKTMDNYYIYDVGTGKVLQCNEKEYNFLNNLWYENSFHYINKIYTLCPDLIDTLLKEISEFNLLDNPPLTKFEIDKNKVIYNSNNLLEQITLEVTQVCNLSCKYCIYQENNTDFRNFNSKNMQWTIAKKAIDYAMEHSGKDIAITFYGGEPLLEIELIKKCIYYSKKFNCKTVSYSMTTNLVLINDEIADFLASEKTFSILCSLDGPQDIHDTKRVLKNGNGSFLQAINGLKKLVEAFGEESKDRIALSMVITSPVTKEKLDSIDKFFRDLSWLPKEISKSISYEKVSSEKEKKHFSKGELKNYKDPITNWNNESDKDTDNFTKNFLQSKMKKIHSLCQVNVGNFLTFFLNDILLFFVHLIRL